MIRAAVLCASLALALAAPAGAQEGSDKARLDDFALPRDEGALRIDQLDEAAERLQPTAPATDDHQLAVPGLPQADHAPVDQLSRPGSAAPAQQVSDPGQSRQLASGSVSSPGDSPPQAAAPLTGSDKCDRQLGAEQLERCLRILELRAAEFDAPEAPRLSAEQALLAVRGEDQAQLAETSSAARLRLASGDPDAELASNQELASIYLDQTQRQPPTAGMTPEEAETGALAEALQGLDIQFPGSGAP